MDTSTSPTAEASDTAWYAFVAAEQVEHTATRKARQAAEDAAERAAAEQVESDSAWLEFFGKMTAVEDTENISSNGDYVE